MQFCCWFCFRGNRKLNRCLAQLFYQIYIWFSSPLIYQHSQSSWRKTAAELFLHQEWRWANPQKGLFSGNRKVQPDSVTFPRHGCEEHLCVVLLCPYFLPTTVFISLESVEKPSSSVRGQVVEPCECSGQGSRTGDMNCLLDSLDINAPMRTH